jgi:chromosome segregation ATPase
MKRLLIGIVTVCMAAWLPHAHAQTLEQQLRAQLADARSQLQDLQGQQAQWQAQKTQLEQERDDARKAADAAKAQLGKDQAGSTQDASALAAERSAREQDEGKIESLQKALAAATAQSHTQEQRSGDLATQLGQAQGQVTTCTARNQKLYQVGSEILDAYSHMTVGTVIASREPFAASERVKLENAAQDYGDRLYEQRYDPRATSVKKP